MSEMHPVPREDDAVVDRERQWAVYRCAHGCLHVTLDRLMLTLTEAEFHALQALMRRACDRFHRDGPVETAHATSIRAH